MFDIGLQELLVILVIALLVFGPERLPELGRKLGRALREFRRASEEFRTTVETNLHLDDREPPREQATIQESPSSTIAEQDPAPADPSRASVPAAAGVGLAGGNAPGLSSEPYCAKRGGRLVHKRDCAWVTRFEGAEVYFSRLAEVRDHSLVACPVCEPMTPPSEADLAESEITA